MTVKLHYETLALDNAKATKPKTRPTGAVFTYKALKVKSHLKAGKDVDKSS
jgi:hypothetical protein